MTVRICKESFDPWREARQYQESSAAMPGKSGATSLFIGTMRDFNEGDDILGMTLEYYPGMTEKELENIVAEACSRWSVIDILVVHRVGEILPNEPIVLVSVWASHRGDAYDANRYVMEALKSKAPFWKKELLKSQHQRWLAGNTDGYLKPRGTR
ncbi:MAG: molybdenum cofactor biosynthesis protein MoaE [Gammaproteobacteria bacterium]